MTPLAVAQASSLCNSLCHSQDGCATMLLAQGLDDLIGIIIVILFIIVPVIGQIIAKMNKAPGPPAGGPKGAGRPAAGNKDINDEIGDFLRRAARGLGKQVKQAQQQMQQQPPRQPIARPAAAQVVRERPIEAQVLGGGHRETVQAEIDTGQFTRRAAKLGGKVVRSEKQLDKHLHQVFNHELGDLARTSSKTAGQRLTKQQQPVAMPPTAAAGFAALLGSAENIRRAIVINEILTRPEDRWNL